MEEDEWRLILSGEGSKQVVRMGGNGLGINRFGGREKGQLAICEPQSQTILFVSPALQAFSTIFFRIAVTMSFQEPFF